MDIEVVSNGNEAPKSILRRSNGYPMAQLPSPHAANSAYATSNGIINSKPEHDDFKVVTTTFIDIHRDNTDSKTLQYPNVQQSSTCTLLQCSPAVRKLRHEEQSWTAGQKAAKLAVILAILLAVTLLCTFVILFSFYIGFDTFKCDGGYICDYGSGQEYKGIEDRRAPWNQRRLPRTIEPLMYYLDIQLDMDSFRITGRVSILFTCPQNSTSIIILHHKGNGGGDDTDSNSGATNQQGVGEKGSPGMTLGEPFGPQNLFQSREDRFASEVTIRQVDSNHLIPIEKIFRVPGHEYVVVSTRSIFTLGAFYNITLPVSVSMTNQGVFDHTVETESYNIRPKHIFTLRAFPANTRTFFPCFDEPSFRSNFSVKIEHDSNYKVLLPKPIEYEKRESDFRLRGRVSELYPVPVPTYMLSMIILPNSYNSYPYSYSYHLQHTDNQYNDRNNERVRSPPNGHRRLPSVGIVATVDGETFPMGSYNFKIEETLSHVILSLVSFCESNLKLRYPYTFIYVYFLPHHKTNRRSPFRDQYHPYYGYYSREEDDELEDNVEEEEIARGLSPAAIIIDPSDKSLEEIVQHLFRAVIFHFTHVVLAFNWWDEYWAVVGLCEFLSNKWHNQLPSSHLAINISEAARTFTRHPSSSPSHFSSEDGVNNFESDRPTGNTFTRPSQSWEMLQFQFLRRFWRALESNARSPFHLLPDFTGPTATSDDVNNLQIVSRPQIHPKAAAIFSMLSAKRTFAVRHMINENLCLNNLNYYNNNNKNNKNRQNSHFTNSVDSRTNSHCDSTFHISHLINSYQDIAKDSFRIPAAIFMDRWTKFTELPYVTLETSSGMLNATSYPFNSSKVSIDRGSVDRLPIPVHLVSLNPTQTFDQHLYKVRWIPTLGEQGDLASNEDVNGGWGGPHMPLVFYSQEQTPYFLPNYSLKQWKEIVIQLNTYTTNRVLSDVRTRYSLLYSAYILVQNNRLPTHILLSLINYCSGAPLPSSSSHSQSLTSSSSSYSSSSSSSAKRPGTPGGGGGGGSGFGDGGVITEEHPLIWELISDVTEFTLSIFHSTLPNQLRWFLRSIWSAIYQNCDRIIIDEAASKSADLYKRWSCEAIVAKWACLFQNSPISSDSSSFSSSSFLSSPLSSSSASSSSSSSSLHSSTNTGGSDGASRVYFSCRHTMKETLDWLIVDYQSIQSHQDKLRWLSAVENRAEVIQIGLRSARKPAWDQWWNLFMKEKKNFSTRLRHKMLLGLSENDDKQVNANTLLWHKLTYSRNGETGDPGLTDVEGAVVARGLSNFPQNVLFTLDHLANMDRNHPNPSLYLTNLLNSTSFCPVILKTTSFLTGSDELIKLTSFFSYLTKHNLTACEPIFDRAFKMFDDQVRFYNQSVENTRNWMFEFHQKRMNAS
ncbi:uncharacterized protein LOC142334750 isoform X2 [Convolutriloba macropyga]|uniref:uncharacterized protein LOC142334750 isoform X2 n=1 Tax=Convolutriloba macropyga TaxID=536237 RepID=UPI003F524237